MIPRIIPVLLLKNRGLYKGIKFKDHKYVGDPINTVKIFNDKEVDELIILDIEAGKFNNKTIDFDYLKEVVSEAFMPIGYGGGVSSIDDAKKLFKIGIEKIVLNTNAILNFQLVEELVRYFGSQSVVFSLDVKKTLLGYHCFMRSGQIKTDHEPVKIAKIMQDLGVGEIMLNDIDRDGTLKGYNLDLIKKVSESLNIPLIACGGASSIEDFKKAIDVGAHACAAGAMFVFHGPHRAVIISYPGYTQIKDFFGGKHAGI